MFLAVFLVSVAILLEIRLESEYSVLCFLAIFVGYLVQSSLLYVVLRVWPRLKTQPHTQITSWVPLSPSGTEAGAVATTATTATAPRHYLFSGVNLIVASTCSLVSCEAAARGWSAIDLNMGEMAGAGAGAEVAGIVAVAVVGAQFLSAFALQSVLEYWWHRLMHVPVVYMALHKYHHYYKSPEPFCDLYIHPIESLGYQMILWAPPFAHRLVSSRLALSSMRLPAFLLYMAVMGLCGVLDHSGNVP
jgi:sterol desaturase/sphingolipid hydroxylase (fatty acid hydroxylase superfamily)